MRQQDDIVVSDLPHNLGKMILANRAIDATVICILFCTINFREHYLVVLQFDIFGQ